MIHHRNRLDMHMSWWNWPRLYGCAGLILCLMLLAACSSQTILEVAPVSGYPNKELLVSTGWLNDKLQNSNLRVVDMRTPEEYRVEHIPGAVNVSVEQIAATVNDIPLEFEQSLVQETLNRIGLTPEMTIVAYDDLGMMNSSRFFWTMEYAGHADVRVLHGGWNAWVAEGRPTESGDVVVESSHYPIELQPEFLITAEEINERLDDLGFVVVDARSPAEYNGEVKLADRGGHIPGAVNLVWLEVMTGGDAVYTIEENWQEHLKDDDVEVFKSAVDITQQLDRLGITKDKEVITYCQTLWRGAHTYFLLRLMGFDRVRGYDGSWAEWGNREDLPASP